MTDTPAPNASLAALPGHLYVVATPIGNLADITERARAILGAVDLIACEDTRTTGALLTRFGLRKDLVAYHEHNETEMAETLAAQIAAGRSVAVVSDAGTPVVLAGGASAQHYTAIAGSVVREVSKIQHGGLARPTVAFVDGRGIVVTTGDGAEHVITAADLRRACRCAVCVEEFSGKPLLAPETVAENICPQTIQPMGNYAVAIAWSDGHTSSIYPYDAILKLAAD